MESLVKLFLSILLSNVLKYAFLSIGVYFVVWVFFAGRLKERKLQEKKVGRKQIRMEIFSSMRSMLVFSIVLSLTGLGIEFGIFQPLVKITSFSKLGFLTSAILLLLFQDLYFYFVRRVLHTKALYSIHSHHHKSISPTPLTAYSFSFTEAFIQVAWIPLLGLFIGLNQELLIFTTTLQHIFNVIGHLGFEIYPPQLFKLPLSKFIFSATFHDQHHSGSINKNFSLYLNIWDRMFGTLEPSYDRKFQQNIHKAYWTELENNHDQ